MGDRQVFDRRAFHGLFPAVIGLRGTFPQEPDGPHGTGIGDGGARLDIVEGVALLGAHDRDILRVLVAGEHVVHAGVRQFGGDVPEVVNEEMAEDGGFLSEMGDDAVVHHADDRIASLAGGTGLSLRPFQEVGGDVAADLTELFSVGRVVRGVAVRVDDDDREALLRTRHIGEGPGLSAFRRGVGRFDRGVVPGDVFIKVPEVLLGRRFRLDRFAVRGVEVLRGRVVDVMVAVRHVDFEAGQILFQLFQFGGKRFVRGILSVFGDVTVQEEHVRLRRAHLLQLGVEDGFRLVEHLLVEVDGVLIVRGPLDHGLGDGVHVRHDHDPQVVLPRGRRFIGGKTHWQRQDHGHDHGKQDGEQFVCVFHFVVSFLKSEF